MSSVSSPVATSPVWALHSIWTVFWLGVRQSYRAWKLIVLTVLFLLPTGLVLLGRNVPHGPNPREMEFVFILTFIPNALLPLTALLFGSAMVQDEIEEQTLTYLLMRPTPRWAIYLAKLAAAMVVSLGLSAVFTLVAYAALHWGNWDTFREILRGRALQMIALLALSVFGYCSLFSFVSLIFKRSLIVGVVYIIFLEGVLANIDFVVRKLTVMYYFLVLRKSWLGVEELGNPKLDLATCPTPAQSVATVLGAGLALAVLGALLFATREFRVKTPEGN